MCLQMSIDGFVLDIMNGDDVVVVCVFVLLLRSGRFFLLMVYRVASVFYVFACTYQTRMLMLMVCDLIMGRDAI